MTLKTGDNMISGTKGGYQFFNRIKNAFRQSGPKVAVSTAVPGMRVSDSDDNRLHHCVVAGTTWYEILQAEVVVCMDNEVVCFDNEIVTAPAI